MATPKIVKPFLPMSGQLQIGELARALQAAQQTLAIGSRADVRTVRIFRPGTHDWIIIACVVRLDADKSDETDLSFGALQLARESLELSDLSTTEGIGQELEWSLLMPDNPSGGLQNTRFYSRWYPSRSRHSRTPCWQVSLSSGSNQVHWDRDLARGPFLEAGSAWYAPDLDSAMRKWCDFPLESPGSTNAPQLHFIVPDKRTFIEDLSLSGDGSVQGRISTRAVRPVHAACRGTDNDGQLHFGMAVVCDNVFDWKPPRELRTLDVELLSPESELLDSYRETPAESSWNQSVLVANIERQKDSEIASALLAGEGDRIECKRYLPPHTGNQKSQELPETVVAFANAKGGTIYVGISDKLELTGIETQLRKESGTAGVGTLPELKDWYTRACRKLIAESINPTPQVEMNWLTQDGELVLAIRVEEGRAKPYELPKTGEILFRRGPNNKRISRAEILLYVQQSKSGRVSER
jgi:hypothetical protein